MTNNLITACSQIAPSACDNPRITHLLDQGKAKMALRLAIERANAIVLEAKRDHTHPLFKAALIVDAGHGPIGWSEMQKAIISRFSFVAP